MELQYQFKNMKNSIPNAAKIFFFENKIKECFIYGNSMEPFLSYGEKVKIIPYNGQLKKGHCYAFISKNNLAMHRFIKMEGNKKALFVGDNCLFFDHINISDVIGELFSYQNQSVLCLLSLINIFFFVFINIFSNFTVLNNFRRIVVRNIIKFDQKKGISIEKKI